MSLAILPSGELASSSYDSTIRIWNTTTWKVRQILKGHEGPVNKLVALPNGMIISAGVLSADKTGILKWF